MLPCGGCSHAAVSCWIGAHAGPISRRPLDPPVDGLVSQPAILLPQGTYLLGVSRSSLPDGSSPTILDYRVSVDPDPPLPPGGDDEPNDDATTATAISGTFALSGDAGGSEVVYAWAVEGQDAGRAWALHAEGQVGAACYLTLADDAANQLVSVPADPLGDAHLYDLELSAGTYLVSVSLWGDGVRLYAPSSQSIDLGDADAEPNDLVGQALVLDRVTLVARGRLARAGDVDVFRLTLDAELAAKQVRITLLSRGMTGRQLCLLDLLGTPLQCRSGEGSSVLRGLLLASGEHIIAVSGKSSLTDPYHLRVDPTIPPVPDFETEPNDTPATASGFDAGIAMRGAPGGWRPGPPLGHRVGRAAAMRLDATGDDISQLRSDPGGRPDLASADVAGDGRSALLTDMYLIPGDHRLRIDGTGDYTLGLTPLGPPAARQRA